jgi:putative redox protein
MPQEKIVVARAQAALGSENYRTVIRAGRHEIVSDEPASHGGADAGAAPFELLLSGLGACTAITLRMYAARKGWPLGEVHVELRYTREGDRGQIDRTLTLEGPLDEAQRARLADVAERTPVTLVVKNGVAVVTELR